MAAHLLLLAPSRFRCTAAAAPCSVLAAARVLLFRGLGDSSSAHLNVLPLPQPPGSAAPGCTLPCGQRTQQQQEPHHLHQWQQPRWLPQQQHHRAQHPNIQQLRSFHNQGRLQQPNPGSTTRTGAAAAGARLPGSGFTTLPNLLSLSRAAMGPWLVYAMTSQQWPVAVALTAAAGVSDTHASRQQTGICMDTPCSDRRPHSRSDRTHAGKQKGCGLSQACGKHAPPNLPPLDILLPQCTSPKCLSSSHFASTSKRRFEPMLPRHRCCCCIRVLCALPGN
jgi:hypothetical protein